MEVSEIKDHDSLQGWLEALPQDTEAEKEEARCWAVMIAHRAAMRVLPVFWESYRFRNVDERPSKKTEDISSVLHAELSAIAITVLLEKPDSEIEGHIENRLRGFISAAPNPLWRPYVWVIYTIFEKSISGDQIAIRSIWGANVELAELSASAEQDGWRAIRADCEVLSSGRRLTGKELWRGGNPLIQFWEALRPKILAQGEGWQFWVEFYENALHGRPQDYDLLTKIATDERIDWDKGADHVNALIAEIIRTHKPARKTPSEKAVEVAADRLIRAAIGNFTFDAMAEVIRIVPFAEDIRFMRDPDALRRVMDDVGAIRDQLETFQCAVERRAQTQGCAGDIAAYLKSILSEFDRAKDHDELRVGNIIEYGGILQHYCLDESARAELRPLDNALERHVNALLAVTHRHFASTFLRFEPLHALELGEDDPHEMLSDLRDSIRGLKAASKTEITPLDREGWAVLDAMADDLDRYIRAHFMATDPRVLDSLRREMSFKMAQLQVSLALYSVKGREQAKTLGEIADKLVTVDNRVNTVGGMWAIIKTWLRVGQG